MLTCPACAATTEPIVRVRDLAICGGCGASVVVKDAEVTRAAHHHIEDFSDEEIAALKKARRGLVRRRP